MSEFANGCCFACAVHARHHQDHWLLRANVKLLLQWHEQVCNGLYEQSFDRCRVGGFGGFDASLKVFQQVFSGFDACIGQQQGRF